MSIGFVSITPQVKPARVYIYSFSVLLLVLFAGLRVEGVGSDDLAYIKIFEQIQTDGFSFENLWGSYQRYNIEPSFYLLNIFATFFSGSYTSLFLTVAIFSIGISAYNFYRLSPTLSMIAIALFFSHMFLYRDLNQIRAACAAATSLFLVYTVFNRYLLRSILLVFISASLHVASFSMVLTLPLLYIAVSRVRIAVLLFSSVIVSALGFSKLLVQLPLPVFLERRITSYMNNPDHAYSLGLLDITNLKNIVLLLSFLFFWKKLTLTNRYFKIMVAFFALGVSWRLVFSDFAIVAGRVATFFTSVEVMLVAMLFFVLRPRFVSYILIVVYAFSMLYLNLYVKPGRHEYVSILY